MAASKNEATFSTVLAAGSVLSYNECKKRFAVESEAFEGSRDEEIAAHPERYPVFNIDFSGLTVEQLADWSLFHTAIIDKARKEFRKKDPEQAAEWRAQWEATEQGNPIVELSAKDMAGMKLPESAAEVAAKVEKMASKMSPEMIEALMEKLKAQMK